MSVSGSHSGPMKSEPLSFLQHPPPPCDSNVWRWLRTTVLDLCYWKCGPWTKALKSCKSLLEMHSPGPILDLMKLSPHFNQSPGDVYTQQIYKP